MPYHQMIGFGDQSLLSTTGTSIGFLDKIQAGNIGGACEAVHSSAAEVNSIAFSRCIFVKP